MQHLVRLISILIISLVYPYSASYAEVSDQDSIKISLLTCSPGGEEIYELFGHTAIRIQNEKEDLVYNYGLFDFNAPHFIWRYIKGETDYALGIQPYSHFISVYTARGSEVREQKLNLTSTEKQKLYETLQENARPENRIYRYNYFFDNCATRPRLKIEESINGLIKYDERVDTETFRDALHKHLAGHAWAQFGIDLCLGKDADKQMEETDRYFMPVYLHEAFRRALIVPSQGDFRDLVLSDTLLNRIPTAPKESATDESFWTPQTCGILLLLLIAGISIYGLIRNRLFWGIDVVLFSLAGCAGCILAFLSLYSQHPAVDSNWNLVVFHPFHLFYMPVFIYNMYKGNRDFYHPLNAIILTPFLLFFSSLPQEINTAVVPLALCLWVRSVCHTIFLADRWK